MKIIDTFTKDKQHTPREWHHSQEVLLKEWAEISSCFRWLHERSHLMFKRQNMYFVLPVIILSTITGTLSFAHGSFPENMQPYVPLGIGALNICGAMITTISQFLQVARLMEEHRSVSLSFGKLSRSIRIELALPWNERGSDGRDFLKICRTEMDRLMEQSPSIPICILTIFENTFADDIAQDVFFRPEILDIHAVTVYDPTQESHVKRVADIVATAAGKLKDHQMHRESKFMSTSSLKRAVITPRAQVIHELEELNVGGSVKAKLHALGQQTSKRAHVGIPVFMIDPAKQEGGDGDGGGSNSSEVDLAGEEEEEDEKKD